MRVVELDPTSYDGWVYLGISVSGSVVESRGGWSDTDPHASVAWENLGLSIPGNDETVRVCGREVRCFMRVVELDPTSYDGWVYLGISVSGSVVESRGGWS
eukprot:PhM_4_TR14096/c1_g2_i1/m.92314